MKDLFPEYVKYTAQWLQEKATEWLSVGTHSHGFFTSHLPDSPPSSASLAPSGSDDEDENLMYIGR